MRIKGEVEQVNNTGTIAVLGIFVADAVYRAPAIPQIGETRIGSGFALGPGGKGSNQAVAAGRLGANVRFLSRLGKDAYGEMALATWQQAKVEPEIVYDMENGTGAAGIFVDQNTGDNAIVVYPGAAAAISVDDMEQWRHVIAESAVFVTQLEQPLAAAVHGLKIAREAGTRTILNPAPAMALDDEIVALCDFITPNETEAAQLTGIKVTGVGDAALAARSLINKGAGAAIITLGGEGVLYHDRHSETHFPAVSAGPVVDTTGAGDAFNGAFAAALASAMASDEAIRFAIVAAGISVTRHGAAASMPSKSEVETALAACQT